MAGVRDGGLIKAGPWPLGVDNTSQEGDLPTDQFGARPIALREAVNIDFSAAGRPKRRRGYTPVRAGTLVHSLWSDDRLGFGLVVDNGALLAVMPDMTTHALGVAVGNQPLSYALINDRVYFTNAATSGLVGMDLVAHSWAPECPGQPTATATTGASLDAGIYQVAVTFTDALGRESGAALAAQVDVVQNGAIELTQMPQPVLAGAQLLNIYVSGANDQVLRLYAAVPAGTTVGFIGARAEGRPLMTALLQALPPGQIVRGGHGRQWVARGDQLLWSEPLRYGLYAPGRNGMRFNAPIDLVEPVADGTGGAGVFVAVGNHTYWYGDADPAKWTQVVAAHAGAVPGSSVVIAGSSVGQNTDAPVVMWLSRNGKFVVGLPGGDVVELKNVAVADDADRAAAFVREQNGSTHLVAALRAPQKQGLAVSDTAYAHVVHRDAP